MTLNFMTSSSGIERPGTHLIKAKAYLSLREYSDRLMLDELKALGLEVEGSKELAEVEVLWRCLNSSSASTRLAVVSMARGNLPRCLHAET
jgi:hypothetical protein